MPFRPPKLVTFFLLDFKHKMDTIIIIVQTMLTVSAFPTRIADESGSENSSASLTLWPALFPASIKVCVLLCAPGPGKSKLRNGWSCFEVNDKTVLNKCGCDRRHSHICGEHICICTMRVFEKLCNSHSRRRAVNSTLICCNCFSLKE